MTETQDNDLELMQAQAVELLVQAGIQAKSAVQVADSMFTGLRQSWGGQMFRVHEHDEDKEQWSQGFMTSMYTHAIVALHMLDLSLDECQRIAGCIISEIAQDWQSISIYITKHGKQSKEVIEQRDAHIRARLASGTDPKKLGQDYNLSIQHIYRIGKGIKPAIEKNQFSLFENP